ncbi:hypothetical protein Avbf_03178 [Armadillidium vulgare]|nr:hypothetical protein Avbf_03178 [Armadillidium vulgare]
MLDQGLLHPWYFPQQRKDSSGATATKVTTSATVTEVRQNRRLLRGILLFLQALIAAVPSFDGERKYYSLPSRSPSPQRYTPVSSIFKRNNTYENDERIRSNFRSRSTSPQRLTPASSYYRRQNNSEGRENGFYSPNYSQRSSQQSSPHFLSLFNSNNSNSSSPISETTKLFNRSNYNSLNKFYTDPTRPKYHSLPRNLFSTKTNSSNRDNLFNIFDKNTLINNASNNNNNNNNNNNDINKRFYDHRTFTNSNNSGCRFNNIFCPAARQNLTKTHVVSSNRNPDNQFLPNTLPDMSNHRMTSPRRFSEEPSPFRRPLDTSDVYSDYQALQRKLSEAGVRKLSENVCEKQYYKEYKTLCNKH